MSTSYRIEVYRPHPDNPESFMKSAWSQDTAPHHVDLVGERPCAFALVIRIVGGEEMVLERWRVDAKGRVLRARFTELEPELEQGGPYPTETQRAFFAPYRPPAAFEHCACGRRADGHPRNGCVAFIATY